MSLEVGKKYRMKRDLGKSKLLIKGEEVQLALDKDGNPIRGVSTGVTMVCRPTNKSAGFFIRENMVEPA